MAAASPSSAPAASARSMRANAAAHPGLTLKYVVDPVAAAAEALAARVRRGGRQRRARRWPIRTSPASSSPAPPTPTSTTAWRAAAAGKAIFCEKPIDLDLARARAAAPQLAGARLLLGFNRRFDPQLPGAEGAARRRRGRHAGDAEHRQPRPGPAADRLREGQRRPLPRHGDPRLRHRPLAAGRGGRPRCSPPPAAWSIRPSARPATSTPPRPCCAPPRASSA